MFKFWSCGRTFLLNQTVLMLASKGFEPSNLISIFIRKDAYDGRKVYDLHGSHSVNTPNHNALAKTQTG